MTDINNTSNTSKSLNLKKELKRHILDMNEKEQYILIKHIIFSITFGADQSHLFPEMIMACGTSNIAIKKLVYKFLITYFNRNHDMTMLTMNALIKDSHDPSPLVRGLALRTMSSFHISEIQDYIFPRVIECLDDSSDYVKRCAIFSCSRIAETNSDLLKKNYIIKRLYQLIRSENKQISLNAICALDEILKEDGGIVMTRKIATYIIKNFGEFNQWGKSIALEFLSRFKPKDTEFVIFVMNSLDPFLSNGEVSVTIQLVKLFVRYTSIIPKLREVLYQRVVDPLLYCYKITNPENQAIILSLFELFLDFHIDLFKEHWKSFLIKPKDPIFLMKRKLYLLEKIVNEDNVKDILDDLYQYICKASLGTILDDMVLVICTISSKYMPTIEQTYEIIFKLLQREDKKIFDSVFKGIYPILKYTPQIFNDLIPHIINIDFSFLSEKSVIVFLWIIGEYGCNSEISIEIVENFMKEYETNTSQIKNQLLTVCTKLFITMPVHIKPILLKLFNCGINDNSPFVKNHTIFIANLIKDGIDTAKSILCEKIEVYCKHETIQELLRKDEMMEEFDINSIFSVK